MADCHFNEDPSSLLSDARKYIKDVDPSNFSIVQSETALKLAEAAYADKQGKTAEPPKLFDAAVKSIDAKTGVFGIGPDSETVSKVAVELQRAAHFDSAGNSMGAEQSLNAATKAVRQNYSYLSWSSYIPTVTSIDIAQANHLQATGKPADALKAMSAAQTSVQDFLNQTSPTWETITAAEVAVDLATSRLLERQGKPKDAANMLQTAEVHLLEHANAWTKPNNDTTRRLGAAIAIEKAGAAFRNGDCTTATSILDDLNKRAEQDRGTFATVLSNDGAIKIHSAVNIAKIGMQTGTDVSVATNMLLTNISMIGGKSKSAR